MGKADIAVIKSPAVHGTQPNFRNTVLEVYEPIHELEKH